MKIDSFFISKINESVLNSLETPEKITEYLKKSVTLGLAKYQLMNEK
jgi:hypothetical protein